MLINYPHGLGDCIMATPAMRSFWKETGEKVNIAMLERFRSSELLVNCPYIDTIHYVPDPWNDYKKPSIGFKEVTALINEIDPNSIEIPSDRRTHKIHLVARAMNVALDSTNMEIFTTDKDIKIAEKIIKEHVGDTPFGFVQTSAGNKKKDLSDGYGRKWLKETKGLDHVIEVGDTFQFDDFNINIQFEIMRRACAVCLPDSVFYHACSAMDKDVDFVYFRRRSLIRRVGSLNRKIKQNVRLRL